MSSSLEQQGGVGGGGAVVVSVGSGSIITWLQKVAQAESDWSSAGERIMSSSALLSSSLHLSLVTSPVSLPFLTPFVWPT